MKWEKVRLGKFITPKKGFAFKSSKYVASGVPIVRVSNFTNDSISNDDLKYYPLEEKVNFGEFELCEKDVIIQTVGSWQNNPASVVGKVVRVPYYLDGALLNQNAVKLIPKNSIDKNYLFYRLKTDAFKGHVLGEARGAANQASITLDTIKSFEFLIPDKKKQIKIGNILSSYDDLIENNQKQIKLLEEAAQRLYKEWFVDLRFPGYENTPIIDGVPEGWSKKQLVNVFDYVRGKSYSSKEIVNSGNTLLINLKNIRAFGGYNRNAEKYYVGKYGDSQKVQAGDIIMSVTDMTQERRLVGHVAIVPNIPKTMIFSMDLIKLIPLTVKNSFLYSTMFFGGYSKRIATLANGTNVLHLKPESMMNMELLVPSNEIMIKYDDKFRNFYQRIEVLENQNIILAEARGRLLPKLMNGEVEV